VADLNDFARLWNEYPTGTSDEVKRHIGGAVNADWITNTCAIRVSRCLNYGGMPVPSNVPGLSTIKGGDGKSYAFRVRELKAWLEDVLGPPPITHTYAGTGGPPPPEIEGKKGIICFDVTGWSDATGHFDLWNGGRCANHGYFDLASAVHLWPIGDDAAPAQTIGQHSTPPPALQKLTGSVGAGGANAPDDVKLVQTLLTARGLDPGPIDGVVGPATIAAIKSFQARFATDPDGRVDVNGRTFRELNGL
jgi:hypothetical protein